MFIFDKNYCNLNINDTVIYNSNKLIITDINDNLILSNGEEIEVTDFIVLNDIELVKNYLGEEGGLF